LLAGADEQRACISPSEDQVIPMDAAHADAGGIGVVTDAGGRRFAAGERAAGFVGLR